MLNEILWTASPKSLRLTVTTIQTQMETKVKCVNQ